MTPISSIPTPWRLSHSARESITQSESGYIAAVVIDRLDPVIPGDLHALLDDHENAPLLLAITKVTAQQHLQSRMVEFAHVSLQQFAFQVFAIRPIGRF